MKKIITTIILTMSLLNTSACINSDSDAKTNEKKEVKSKSPRKYKGYVNAPEFSKGLDWINTNSPITLKSLRGKFVLIDFWTYACINCMHIIPDLKKLEEKYKNELVVIGVHSAKFKTEKETNNIRSAVLRYEIEHPVVNDKDFKIWNQYTAQAWPTVVVINTEGKIIEEYSGEGFYKDLDIKLSEAIQEAKEYNILNTKQLSFQLDKDKKYNNQLSFPGKVYADESTNTLFISDSNHNRIIVMDLINNEIKDVIGKGSIGLDDGTFENSTFNHPQGVFYKNGILYIADTENHTLREANLKSRTVKTIAGTGQQAKWRPNEGNALENDLNSPWDIIELDNKLYIAMSGSHQLWTYDLKTKLIQNFAGSGYENINDGERLQANLAQPSGLTTDGKNIYFADSEVSAVRYAEIPDSGKVKTIVGKGLFEFDDKDGIGKEAFLQHPLGVVYKDNKLFVADTYNNKIKVIDLNNNMVKSFAGSGKEGLNNGKILDSTFDEPSGLTIYKDKIYVADTNNNLIRIIDTKTSNVSTLKFINPEKIVKIKEYESKK
jgi:thiol-disulfide isomerase/thioredoxin